MERVEHTESTVEVFENDIELYLNQFMMENNIDDFRTMPQAVWNAAMMYIRRKVFFDKSVLKQKENVYSNNTITPSTCNAYDYELLNRIADYYILLCNINNKEVSIMGFSKLTGINSDIIYQWNSNIYINNDNHGTRGNGNRELSTTSASIYEKLMHEREESLSAKLADGKQNPVGVLAILNRHYQWNMPGVTRENKQAALSSKDLPKLSVNGVQFIENIQNE